MSKLELKVPPPVVALIAAFLMWLVSRIIAPFALCGPADVVSQHVLKL